MRTRKHEIKVRLDDKELSRLDAMVAKTVLSREAFIREMLAGYQLVEAPNEDLNELISQIARLGNNVNTMLFTMRVKGFIDRYKLEDAVTGLWEARRMILQLFIPYHKKRGTLKEGDGSE